MKKTWTLVVISLLGLALFSACASNADTLPSPAPSASVTPSAMPEATPAPSASAMPSATVQPAGVNTVEDARRRHHARVESEHIAEAGRGHHPRSGD